MLVAAATTGCRDMPKTQSESHVPDARNISFLQVRDLNGQNIDLKNYAGKTVVMNLWATWCKPCIAEMPSIEKAQAILKDEAVIFLLASGENAEEIEAFRMNHQYPFMYVRLENLEDLAVQALPTTYIFNPDGKLVFSETGARPWDDSASINMILKITKQHD